MDDYKKAILDRIEELRESNSPFALSRISILLDLLGELERER